MWHRMSTARATAPDLVTLASLQAALDSVVEIEELFTQVYLPIHTASSARRLNLLASEMRSLLVRLLHIESP
jgi:hypothetical protein